MWDGVGETMMAIEMGDKKKRRGGAGGLGSEALRRKSKLFL